MCAQIVAAARLRARAGPPRVETLADSQGSVGDSQGSVGKDALIGLVVGLGLAVAAAVVVAPGCEENQSQCGLMFIVGGSALGAGIGALVGAAWTGLSAQPSSGRGHGQGTLYPYTVGGLHKGGSIAGNRYASVEYLSGLVAVAYLLGLFYASRCCELCCPASAG